MVSAGGFELARAYLPSGIAIGDEFDVSPSGFSQEAPFLTMLSDRKYVVVWQEKNGRGTTIRAATMTGGGDVAQVLDLIQDESGRSVFPRVASLAFGKYAVTWVVQSADLSAGVLFARVLNENGSPGPIARLTSSAESAFRFRSEYDISNLDANRFVAVWTHLDSGAGTSEVYAQAFCAGRRSVIGDRGSAFIPRQ